MSFLPPHGEPEAHRYVRRQRRDHDLHERLFNLDCTRTWCPEISTNRGDG
jgi:hypothetical protein